AASAPDPRPRRDSRAATSPRLPCARAWACGGRLSGPPRPGARELRPNRGGGRPCRLRWLVATAGGERGAGGGWAAELAPGLAQLQARPLLQHRGHHARVEEDVDGEEALVGAEALRLADEAA